MGAEQPRAWVRALEVMPLVGGHEELATVTRVVVPVLAHGLFELARLTVGALAGLEQMRVGRFRAAPVLGDRDLHQLTLVDGAETGLADDHRGMIRTRPGEVKSHRLQVHVADRARAGFDFHDVGVHRADVGHRRQLFLRVRMLVQEMKLRDLRLCPEYQERDEDGESAPDKHVLILSLSWQDDAPRAFACCQGVERRVYGCQRIGAAYQFLQLEPTLPVPPHEPRDVGGGAARSID